MAERPAARGRGNIGILIALVIVLIVGMLAGVSFWSLYGERIAGGAAAPPGPRSIVRVAPLGQATLAPLVERAEPAVVSIAVAQQSPLEQNPLLRDPMYRRFFGVPDEALQPRLSAGSGVIVDAARGIVMTNYHVVRGARAIQVTLNDRREVPAEVVGVDRLTDLAVLRVRADDLVGLPFEEANDIQVGDYVVAIGNPFGLGQTVTAGIVSALGRGLSTHGYENYIQTDAPINPGNSGGPLINLSGEIVGINSAIFGPGQGNVGIGFAVPANIARFVLEQILEHGEVRRGQIGVVLEDFIPGEGAPAEVEGVLVRAVAQDSPAAEAGLRPGDVVVAARGRPTPDPTTLRNAVGLTEIGQELPLTVLRGGERLELAVPVAAGPTPEGEEPLVLTR